MISLKLPAEDGGDWVNSLDLSAVNDCLDGSAEFPDNTGCAGLLVSGGPRLKLNLWREESDSLWKGQLLRNNKSLDWPKNSPLHSWGENG